MYTDFLGLIYPELFQFNLGHFFWDTLQILWSTDRQNDGFQSSHLLKLFAPLKGPGRLIQWAIEIANILLRRYYTKSVTFSDFKLALGSSTFDCKGILQINLLTRAQNNDLCSWGRFS